MVTGIDEEYYAIQYKAHIFGNPESIFWPEDGMNKYNTEAEARLGASDFIHMSVNGEMRIIFVKRRIEYGKPMTEKELKAEANGHTAT
jgi:hypothetical protein